MKKIVLSIAGVMAAVAFAPEASAVPLFARQTGMACSACHFQHFPLLNGFGRAFKSAGFTMMGAQGKVEGEHLDIPAVLNMNILTSAYYQNEKGSIGGAVGGGGPKYGLPGSGGELSLFYGGRIAEFAGFLSELGLAGAAGTGAAKLLMLFPVGDTRVGASLYMGGQGAAYGYEVLNTGAADTHKMMGNGGPNKQHMAATYAAGYMGARTNATGINFIATNPNIGYVTVGKFADVAVGTAVNTLPLTYVRGAYLFNAAGWDSAVGIQNFSGNMSTLTPAALATYRLTVVDAQFQGEIGGMSTGIYLGYATAPADLNGNMMAGGWSTLRRTGAIAVAPGVGTTKSTSFNVAGSLEVLPGIATVQAAYRAAKVGNAVVGALTGDTDNAFMIGGTYELAQNVELGLNYTTQSGSAWNGVVAPVGKTATTLLLEVLF